MKAEEQKGNKKSNNGDSKGSATNAAEIQAWLVSYLANELGMDPREIDVTTSFDSYGLSSASAVFMTSDLSEWLGSEVDPVLPYDYPNIEALARRLAEPQEIGADA